MQDLLRPAPLVEVQLLFVPTEALLSFALALVFASREQPAAVVAGGSMTALRALEEFAHVGLLEHARRRDAERGAEATGDAVVALLKRARVDAHKAAAGREREPPVLGRLALADRAA